MSHKDLQHMSVIQQLLDGKMTVQEAAQACNLSTRQVHRLKKKAAEQGVESIRHGNLGRKPKHSVPTEVEEHIVELYRTKYADYNFTHFSDLIKEHEGCALSRSTIYRILTDAGFTSVRKKRRSKSFRQTGVTQASAE